MDQEQSKDLLTWDTHQVSEIEKGLLLDLCFFTDQQALQDQFCKAAESQLCKYAVNQVSGIILTYRQGNQGLAG